MTLDIKP